MAIVDQGKKPRRYRPPRRAIPKPGSKLFEHPGEVYRERTGRDPKDDALPGLVVALLLELRRRHNREFVSKAKRLLRRPRLLPLAEVPGWFRSALERVRSALPTASPELAADPIVGAFFLDDALDRLLKVGELFPAVEELEVPDEVIGPLVRLVHTTSKIVRDERANAHALFGFYAGVLLSYGPSREEPSPSLLALLAVDAKLEKPPPRFDVWDDRFDLWRPRLKAWMSALRKQRTKEKQEAALYRELLSWSSKFR